MPDDRRKARRRVVQHPERTTAARYGEGIKGRGRGCAPWGGIGGKIGARVEGRQAGRHDEAKRFGVSEWCGCSSSRVRIYIAAIYSIFIYIYYLYIYNINIISIYLIIYINIIPFSPFLCNTSVLYVKNNIYIYCKLLYINVLRVFPSLSLYLCRLWELNTPPPPDSHHTHHTHPFP